jgi:uncharacterized protein (TIRG00374 family)
MSEGEGPYTTHRVPLPATGPLPAEPESKSFTGRRAFWPILLSLVVLVFIGWLTWEPGALAEFLRVVNLWFILAAACLLTLRVFVGGYRLKYSSHHALTYSAAVRGQVIWDFASSVTPSIIGGAPVAAILISRDDGRPIGEITAIMLFAMLMDQIWFVIAVFLLVTASLFVDVYPDSLGRIGAGFFTTYFVAMMVWAAFFAYSTLLRPELLQSLVRRVVKLKWLVRFKDKVEAELEGWGERAKILRSQPLRFYMYGIIFAGLAWTFRYVTLYLIVRSVHEIPNAIQFIARTMAMLHLALILPTPGGSGGIEGMYALFFTEPLIPKGFVAPTLLVWRFMAYYLAIAVGLVITTHVVDRWRKRRS